MEPMLRRIAGAAIRHHARNLLLTADLLDPPNGYRPQQDSLPERVRLRDGRTLEVTIDELAAANALEDVDLFAPDDEWPAFTPDIATTIYGRAATNGRPS